VKDWIALARPRQWTKNLLLYAAFLFTVGEAWGPGDDGHGLRLFQQATLAFVAFSLLSSAGYLLNDARDAATDRLHPRKRHRPIAAGRIAPQRALAGAAVLAALGLLIGAALGGPFVATAAAYAMGTSAYTFALKRLAVIDVTAVALLFVLRVLAGAMAIEVSASAWLLACTLAGALFVASVKRQQDRWLMGERAPEHRETAAETRWTRTLIVVAAVATTGLYAAYTLVAETVPSNGAMLFTAPFVPAACARYWFVARARPDRDADEVAFRDPWMLLLVVGFLVAAVSILVRG